ncbi:MAG: site-2 protease family protein, partial [Spirulinaceae cyanobacterium]
MELLLLVLLGLITYLIVQRSVASITKTPVWILWLVMMTPALIWTVWTVLVDSEAIPVPLMVIPFVVCPILYWLLIQWGRPKLEKAEKETTSESEEEKSPEENSPEDLPSKVRPITQNEEKQLRNCFPWSIYYLQNLDYRPQAILCLGKLRSNP